MVDSDGALVGVRVLEFTHLVFGPQCGQMLHDLGADMIKVERPGLGDLSRSIPISLQDTRPPYFHANNRGKRSIALQLGTPDGIGVARRLVEATDVLLENLAPQAMERLGLGYAACTSINERLIYASGSTFGSEGPLAARRGADLAGQAFGGLVAATGPVEQPSPVGVVAADSTAGLVLCNAILGALLARVRTGRGQRVETSLYGGATWLGAAELTYALIADEQYPRFGGGHPSLSPQGLYGVYGTADGHLALLGVGDEEWTPFLEALELTEIESDPRFLDAKSRVMHAEELREVVQTRLRERDTADWATRLAAANVRFAPVQDYRMIAVDEQASVMGYVRRFEGENGASVQAVGNPIRMSETPVSPAARAPELGEHTEEVLLEAGYDWAGIEALRESGAI